MSPEKCCNQNKIRIVEKASRDLAKTLPASDSDCDNYHRSIFDSLKNNDRQIYDLVNDEYKRVKNCIHLIAAENQCSPAVLAALGSIVQNKTTEGFIGERFHGGCQVVDGIEKIAVERAKQSFKAQYANVQPHSGTQANQVVFAAVLQKGDKILSLAMDQGGHVSHGDKVSWAAKFFEVENYCVKPKTFLLDYDDIEAKAKKFKPKLIICGATAYTRQIDFQRFRAIADKVNALLMADISHIASLIIAGLHPSPIDYAHFTTTSTYKPGGPRGGLILMGSDCSRIFTLDNKQMPLWKFLQRATFPAVQGTPYLNNIAAKAVFFKETLSQEYKLRQLNIIENANCLAKSMSELGFKVLTGGTDNHMVLIDVSKFRKGLTGYIAQHCLEDCCIIVNMNKLPFDKKPASITSGLRLGTPIVTKNKMGLEQMRQISEIINAVLTNVEIISDTEYKINADLKQEMIARVSNICQKFPFDN